MGHRMLTLDRQLHTSAADERMMVFEGQGVAPVAAGQRCWLR
jgi:hypothetical protein